MNSKFYKVIYSKTTCRFVVVSDIATNNGKSSANVSSNIRACSLLMKFSIKDIVVSLLLIGSICEPVYAKSQIFADRNAPKNNQAQVLKTANGIAQINITTPTQRGVSMNQYRQFDIDKEGAVLNNSRKAVETQLGGWISGNQNLNKSEAKVIVNQVNSNNPSQLKGYIEVGGKQAEVIVANPSGIVSNGGGFINANKVQLVSGKVNIDNGEVAGFNVDKHNKISIQKNGLDVSDTEYTQIISAANEINGKIYGNKSIKVSAVSGNVDKDGNGKDTQNVSVDVSHLGGMYAGKITMVGNKHGFAVNNAGQLIANTQISIDADGNINNKPTGLIAAKEIKLKAKNFNNQGRTEGFDSITTDLSGDLNNSGRLSSNGTTLINALTGWLNNSGTINSNKLIANTAYFNNSGVLNIASSLEMLFKDGLNNSGTISSSGATAIRANNGDIDNSGTIVSGQLKTYSKNLYNSGVIAATNLIATYLSGSLNNTGLINSNGTTQINAAQGEINNSGEINGNQVTFNTQNLNNTENGTINAISYLTANLSGSLNNDGKIINNGISQINAINGDINNKGEISSNEFIANSKNINNYNTLNVNRNLLTNLSGRLSNSGIIRNNGISYINTDNLSNTGLINANQINITSNQINNSGSIEANEGIIANVSGSVSNNGLFNSNGITYINADGTISNSGRIYGNHIALGAYKLINGNGNNNNPSYSGSGGVIAARNRLDIGVNEIYNNGVNAEIILANGSFAIGGQLDENGYAYGLSDTLINDGGLIALNGSGIFGVNNLINKNIDDSLKVEEKLIDSRRIDSYTFVGDGQEYIVGEDGDIVTKRKDIYFNLNENGQEKHQTDATVIHRSHYDTTGTLHSNYQRDIYMEEVVDNQPGRIYIGGSLIANGSNWVNKDSEILMGGTLSGSLSGIVIDETPMNGRIEKKGNYDRAEYKNPTLSAGKYKWHYGGEINSSEAISEEALQYIVKEGVDTNIQNQNIASASNNNVDDIKLNATTQAVDLPMVTHRLPNINSSRYNINNPNQPLKETDAKYTEYTQWLSDSYIIGRLEPNNLHKNIKDNISYNLSGRLNNLNNRKYTGSIIFANNIDLSNLDTLTNSGTIKTRQTMNLNGKQINNSGRLQGDIVRANADKININGGKVIADSAIIMTGKEIDISSTTNTNQDGTTIINKVGQLKITDNNKDSIIYLNADKKLTTKAADIQNNSINGNTTISGSEIELGTITTSHKETFGSATDKNHRIVETATENGTNINSIGDIQIIATKGKINGTAVNINSKDGSTILYGKAGIDIKEGRKTIDLDEAYQTKSRDLLSKKTTNYQIQRNDDLAVNSNITGKEILIKSAKDIDLTGTNAVSDNGTLIYSENGDVKINAAKNFYNIEEERKVKKSGLLGTGGIGFTIGQQKTKTESDNTAVIHSGSMVGSLNGDTTIYAGKTYTQTGSTVSSVNGKTTISGSQVNITAAQNRNEDKYKQTFEQKGLTVSLSSPITDLAQKTVQSAQKVGKSKNARINAMAAANAGYGVYSMVAKDPTTGVSVMDNAQTAVNHIADGNLQNAAKSASVKVSIAYGQQKSKTESNTQSTTAQESQVLGERVSITARDSDINIIGSDISGRLNTDLTAANNVNIQSFAETYTNRSNNQSSGFSVGATFEVGNGMAFGINASANAGKGKANADNISHRNSHIGSSTGQTNITAGETLNIQGGQVQGKGVGISAKDLNIESLHDTAIYHSKQQNLSGSVTIGAGANGNIGYNQSKINADYASVNEQSGIFAGDDGYRINVKNHTDLKGGLITSSNKAEMDGKNSFSTGTISFEDIANRSEYSGSSFGIGLSGSMGGGESMPKEVGGVKLNSYGNNKTVLTSQTDQNGSYQTKEVGALSMSKNVGFGSDSDSQSSVTHSGINTSNIAIRDEDKQLALTGKSAEDAKKAVKTDVTLENYAENAGYLANNFDAQSVQAEIDLQREVRQDFDKNRQALKQEIRQKANEKYELAIEERRKNGGKETEKSKQLDLEGRKIEKTAEYIDTALGIIWGGDIGTATIQVTAQHADAFAQQAFRSKQNGQVYKVDCSGAAAQYFCKDINNVKESIKNKDQSLIVKEENKDAEFEGVATQIFDVREIMDGKEKTISNPGIFNDKEQAFRNAIKQNPEAAANGTLYVVINNPSMGVVPFVSEVVFGAAYTKLNDLLGGRLPLSNAENTNVALDLRAKETNTKLNKSAHSRGGMTESISLQYVNNRLGVTGIPIQYSKFYGTATNVAAYTKQTEKNNYVNEDGISTTVQSAVANTDFVGGFVGGNPVTVGNCVGSPVGGCYSHSSYNGAEYIPTHLINDDETKIVNPEASKIANTVDRELEDKIQSNELVKNPTVAKTTVVGKDGNLYYFDSSGNVEVFEPQKLTQIENPKVSSVEIKEINGKKYFEFEGKKYYANPAK